MTRGLSIMLTALLLLTAMFCQAGPAQAEETEAMRTRVRERIIRQIEAEDAVGGIIPSDPVTMCREYRENEIAADADYKGKWVQIRGYVLSVTRGPGDTTAVNLAADNHGLHHVRVELFDVQVQWVDGPEKFRALTVMDVAAGLRKWQPVQVEGFGVGAPMGVPTITQAMLWDATELDEWQQKRQAAQEAGQAQADPDTQGALEQ